MHADLRRRIRDRLAAHRLMAKASRDGDSIGSGGSGDGDSSISSSDGDGNSSISSSDGDGDGDSSIRGSDGDGDSSIRGSGSGDGNSSIRGSDGDGDSDSTRHVRFSTPSKHLKRQVHERLRLAAREKRAHANPVGYASHTKNGNAEMSAAAAVEFALEKARKSRGGATIRYANFTTTIHVPADGNCLFSAVAALLNNGRNPGDKRAVMPDGSLNADRADARVLRGIALQNLRDFVGAENDGGSIRVTGKMLRRLVAEEVCKDTTYLADRITLYNDIIRGTPDNKKPELVPSLEFLQTSSCLMNDRITTLSVDTVCEKHRKRTCRDCSSAAACDKHRGDTARGCADCARCRKECNRTLDSISQIMSFECDGKSHHSMLYWGDDMAIIALSEILNMRIIVLHVSPSSDAGEAKVSEIVMPEGSAFSPNLFGVILLNDAGRHSHYSALSFASQSERTAHLDGATLFTLGSVPRPIVRYCNENSKSPLWWMRLAHERHMYGGDDLEDDELAEREAEMARRRKNREHAERLRTVRRRTTKALGIRDPDAGDDDTSDAEDSIESDRMTGEVRPEDLAGDGVVAKAVVKGKDEVHRAVKRHKDHPLIYDSASDGDEKPKHRRTARTKDGPRTARTARTKDGPRTARTKDGPRKKGWRCAECNAGAGDAVPHNRHADYCEECAYKISMC